jgi:Leucine-rich repeat (LRR) protein
MARDQAFREAEKKIEQARRKGAKRLNLGLMRLAELPESLGELTQLQLVLLFNNQLAALPAWLGQLTQLQSLDLSRNQLTALPESLGNLTQLQWLSLFDNQLTALPESSGKLVRLQSLNLSSNKLTALPESLGNLVRLQLLDLSCNQLMALPEWLGALVQLEDLAVFGNQLRQLPNSVSQLSRLRTISIAANQFTSFPSCITSIKELTALYATHNLIQMLPETICNLEKLEALSLGGNQVWLYDGRSYILGGKTPGNRLESIPVSLAQLERLANLNLDDNPLNPELAAAYKQGLDAVKAYLHAKAAAQITLNEAKLILVGEGEVGKSCLMDALQGAPWREHDTTHGIEIKLFQVPKLSFRAEREISDSQERDFSSPNASRLVEMTRAERTGETITLNGWDFGGQRVYRPTHQLFFSSPAIYLVV